MINLDTIFAFLLFSSPGFALIGASHVWRDEGAGRAAATLAGLLGGGALTLTILELLNFGHSAGSGGVGGAAILEAGNTGIGAIAGGSIAFVTSHMPGAWRRATGVVGGALFVVAVSIYVFEWL